MIEEPPFRQVPPGVVIPVPWMAWLGKIRNFAGSISDHGTTAERPTSGLWVGRPYFDDSLGLPIWVKSVNPTVWVDATGASV
jgi:hypothetical protein